MSSIDRSIDREREVIAAAMIETETHPKAGGQGPRRKSALARQPPWDDQPRRCQPAAALIEPCERRRPRLDRLDRNIEREGRRCHPAGLGYETTRSRSAARLRERTQAGAPNKRAIDCKHHVESNRNSGRSIEG